jgi:hypothetical protein
MIVFFWSRGDVHDLPSPVGRRCRNGLWRAWHDETTHGWLQGLMDAETLRQIGGDMEPRVFGEMIDQEPRKQSLVAAAG